MDTLPPVRGGGFPLLPMVLLDPLASTGGTASRLTTACPQAFLRRPLDKLLTILVAPAWPDPAKESWRSARHSFEKGSVSGVKARPAQAQARQPKAPPRPKPTDLCLIRIARSTTCAHHYPPCEFSFTTGLCHTALLLPLLHFLDIAVNIIALFLPVAR